MDEFECFHVNKNDAEGVRCALNRKGSVTFPLASSDEVGCMIVFVSVDFLKMGIMPFGGNPSGRAYVGIYGRGCNHLAKCEVHPSYVEEKLGLPKCDAEDFANFWNMIWTDNSEGSDESSL